MDTNTIRKWMEGAGLRAEDGPGVGAVGALLPQAGGARVVVRPDGPEASTIICTRLVPAAALAGPWAAPRQQETHQTMFSRIVRQLGDAFPLVRATATDRGAEQMVEFAAPLYHEGLSRQAFVVTLSAVVKAAEALEVIFVERGRLAAAWAKHEKESEAMRKKLEQQLQQGSSAMKPVIAPAERRCPKCNSIVPVGKKFCTEDGTPVR